MRPMITLPAVGRTGQHVLKLDPPEFPGLSENEACRLAAARAAGLRVSDGLLLRDRHGLPGLAVVRFDRPTGLDQPARLAVEDGCQVLGRPRGQVPRHAVAQQAPALLRVTAPVGIARTGPGCLLAEPVHL